MELGRFNSLRDLRLGFYRRLYRALYWRSGGALGRVRRPHMVSLELTNACNMECPHCSRSYMERREGFMEAAVFRRLVDELKTYPYSHLKIVGLGEPALHPHVADFLDYLRGTGIKVQFTTNGTLLERFSPQQICAWPIDILGVSIDGLDARSYERLRPGGNYQVLRRAIEALYAWKQAHGATRPVLQIRHVIMPGTEPAEVERFRRDWLARADQVVFNAFMPARYKTERPDAALARCDDQLFFEANVRWDGRVPLCAFQFGLVPAAKQEWLGDLHHDSLERIWASRRLEEMRTAHRRRNLEPVSFCRSCVATQCRGRLFAAKREHNATHRTLVNAINRIASII